MYSKALKSLSNESDTKEPMPSRISKAIHDMSTKESAGSNVINDDEDDDEDDWKTLAVAFSVVTIVCIVAFVLMRRK